MAAALKPAYLIHGEDHGAIAERRARLRALAEREGGAASVEQLEGESAAPAAVAAALATMTFAIGRRVILVDGVERWRDAEVREHLAPALASISPDTTIALFAREEGRSKAPASLHRAVTQAGGQVLAHVTVKPWELPKWTREQASRLGLTLDPAAARLLVAQVGERQQRVLRELEKLALERSSPGEDGPIGPEEIETRLARSASRKAYALADALLARDAAQALRCYLSLRAQGERLPGLSYLMAARLREALDVCTRLGAGEPQAKIKPTLRMPPKAAERFIAEVSQTDPQRLQEALTTLADLELDTRGGSPVRAKRSAISSLSEETLTLRAIASIGR